MLTDAQKKTFLSLYMTGMGVNMALLAMDIEEEDFGATLDADARFAAKVKRVKAARYEECELTLYDVAQKGENSPRFNDARINLSKDFMRFFNHKMEADAAERDARFNRRLKRKQLDHLLRQTVKPSRPNLAVLTNEEAEFFHSYYDRLVSGEEPTPDESVRYLKLSQKVAAASGEDEEEE